MIFFSGGRKANIYYYLRLLHLSFLAAWNNSTHIRWFIVKLNTLNCTKIMMIYIHLSLVFKNKHCVLLEVQNETKICVLCEVRTET